jgi:hypothetical protein
LCFGVNPFGITVVLLGDFDGLLRDRGRLGLRDGEQPGARMDFGRAILRRHAGGSGCTASTPKLRMWNSCPMNRRVTPLGKKHEIASFDLPTTFKSPLTYQVTQLMADRDKGGFSAYLDNLEKQMQAAVDGVVKKQKKGGTKVEDVIRGRAPRPAPRLRESPGHPSPIPLLTSTLVRNRG